MKRLSVALAVAALAAGCATTPAPSADGASAPVRTASPVDPWENWNRKVFAFNDKVDDAVVRPVAQAYRDNVPELVRTGIGNVLRNIYDVWSTVNQFLQGKPKEGLEMGARVVTNTTIGLFGLVDWGTQVGLTRKSEDFGQTLGVWGFGPGPYVVLPFLGPSTLRDTIALPADRLYSPSSLPETDAGQYSVLALELLNARSDLLDTTKLLDQVALDRYSFVRDAYLSRRLDQVWDGAPPLQDYDDGDDGAAPAQ
ncbi:MlaA family lipoprotein [Rubrivivax gelatinosus]|uniref:MlaA family lipoprotein n=1 Tax=Rubrivivax gelatinosus TaxID=28068 RepID=UPI0002E4EE47|nr:VacJ family lipoprotein [Rubrivivax gelatinosus]MBG6080780.1 phospholipid-binding lipoprotein MlaA [Rubrivivax gelatinosus]